MTEFTTGVQSDTGTGAVTGAADGNAISGDFKYTAKFTLSGSNTAVVALEDTADDFSAARVQHIFQIKGPTAPEGLVLSVDQRDMPNCRFGNGDDGTGIRLNVLAISGGTLTSHAWYE